MLEIALCANAIIAACYFVIAALIFTGLVKQRRLGFNPLGTATGFIFLTSGLSHWIHVENFLLAPEFYRRDPGLWHVALVDSLTVLPATIYLALRRRYGLVIRGQHALLDFQRRLEMAEAMRDIGQDIAAQTDLEAVLRHVVDHALMLLGADYAVVTARDDEGDSHLRVVGNRYDVPDASEWSAAAFAPGTSPAAAAIARRQPFVSEDLTAEPGYASRELALHRIEGGRAALAVPLFRADEVFGSLMVAYRAPRRITRGDLSAAAALANMAAIAIGNARLIESLRRAERMKSEFLSVAAHELKTPVTSLRGFSQLVVKRFDTTGELDPFQVRRALFNIEQQSQKLSRLVTQLLDVSRAESGRLTVQPADTDLCSLVQGVAAGVRQSAGRRTIEVRTPNRPLPARVDPLRIEQVLTNLLDNAVKFSPENGAIEVELSELGGELLLTVSDHGIGIPPEHRGKIFDRFYQAHEGSASAGMGLGLYISAQIVERHGGTIRAEFPEQGGTRFTVTLPRGRVTVGAA
ncbi:MAG TPA: GAF domain-containing sensor histidine kinase [Dehalococcoidia bacterium]|nr:GAF domain-containing sensor histidine kinase [Dehalococcoidia bacterium]